MTLFTAGSNKAKTGANSESRVGCCPCLAYFSHGILPDAKGGGSAIHPSWQVPAPCSRHSSSPWQWWGLLCSCTAAWLRQHARRGGSTAVNCRSHLEKGPCESTAPSSYLCKSPACPVWSHGKDSLRTYPFPCFFRKRKWWQSLLSLLSQQQVHGAPNSIWVLTLAVTFSVRTVTRKMCVCMLSNTRVC